MAAHDTVLHILRTAQLAPAVVAEVRAVVEEPLHGRRVLILRWRRARVTRVPGDTLTAPDGVDGDGLDRRLGVVVG